MDLEKYVASIPGFPKEGIIFRDVTPMLQDAEAFKESVKQLAGFVKSEDVDVVVGPESRGFIFGCPVALELNAGFVPVRKPGKLPREVVSCKYDLEYGSNEIQMHKDSIKKGQKVFIVDDLLATGGTAGAMVQLVRQVKAEIVAFAFVIELFDLGGAKLLKDQYNVDVFSLVKFPGH